jgi:uncharacterized membrane protein YqaE (UPF0057 family)
LISIQFTPFIRAWLKHLDNQDIFLIKSPHPNLLPLEKEQYENLLGLVLLCRITIGTTIRKGKIMRLLLAIFLPFAAFFTIGRPIAGIICLILQITLIGWLPAAICGSVCIGSVQN